MNMWLDKRFKDFERSVSDDMIRGQIPNNFPWEVLSLEQTDASGDLWKLRALCLNLLPNEHNNDLEAHLRFEGECHLNDKALARLGFDKERLRAINEEVTVIQTVQELKMKLTMPKLEIISKTLMSRFASTLIRMYSDQKKLKAIQVNLEKRPVCRFAM